MVKPVSNPPNPWESTYVEWLGEPPEAKLEIFEEEPRSILAENDSPDVGFRWSLNPYRGCFHACAYCQSGETPILMADGRTKALADVKVGEAVYGTKRSGKRRLLVATRVLDRWIHHEAGYRVRVEGQRNLIASGQHRFLTEDGWKSVLDQNGNRDGNRNSLRCDSRLISLKETPSSPGKALSPLAAAIHSVEPIGDVALYDITTGTGDFIANGVVSHNCYARTSHEYLGFGAGTDFDRKIVVKINAPELLRKEISRRAWKGEVIIFSGNTDCYQPLEAVYELTRKCLEVCAEFRNPVAIITKGALVRREAELLARMSKEVSVSVSLSIPIGDDEMSKAIEPGTSPPSQRFETLRILSEAGVRTGVGVAPVIPGLNDNQISSILQRAREAGATSAFLTLVRLSGQTLPVFRERLEQAFPQRAGKIWSAIQQVRGGRFNDTRWHERMHGQGPRWDAIHGLFDVECRRLGFNLDGDEERTENSPSRGFSRPGDQWSLFEDLKP